MIKKSVAIVCLIVITLITAILSSCVTRYFDKKAYVKDTKVDMQDKNKTSSKDEKIDILPNDKENNDKNTTETQMNKKNILEEISENQDAIKQDRKTGIQPSSNNVLVSVEIIKTQKSTEDNSKNKVNNTNNKSEKKKTKTIKKAKPIQEKKEQNTDIKDLKAIPVVVHRVENADRKQYVEQKPIELKKNDESKVEKAENKEEEKIEEKVTNKAVDESKTIYNTIVVEQN